MPDADNFGRWFGSSKVVDAVGKPLVVYHGTDRDFDEFKTHRAGAHFGTAEQANYRIHKAHEGACLVPVFLAIQSPARLPDLGSWGPAETAKALAEEKLISKKAAKDINTMLEEGSGGVAAWNALKAVLAAKKIDGIVYANTQEGVGDSWIAFRPEQIKSSTGNNGAYAVGSPEITDAKFRAQGALDFLKQIDKRAAPHA